MTTPSQRLTAALGDRYRVERELGQGGMATVYLAEDLKHHRQVAIKVLKSEIAAALGPERFLREIQVAARLTHPHILPLHDSGEANGCLYYVMPYIAGESLRETLNRETQLGVDEALRITEQVASALDYAHRQGVIHRDVKPENILLHEGQALVTDFGIALAVKAAGGERLTQTGFAVGTPAYMSPEQASGEREVDARSDVYSLGCVLYEMLTGEPPYTGRTAEAVIAKLLADPIPSARRLRTAIAAALDDTIRQALAKAPADRFDSTAAFTEALRTPASAESDRRSIAVLPFANMSADPENEYFSDGITEDLIAQISKIRSLKVISRTSTERYKGTDKSLRQIGEELGVSTVLEGSVRRAANRVRVVAQLLDAGTDEHLWAETYDRELTDVFAIQSDVALCVATALEAALSPAERDRVEKRATHNMKAYDLFLLGRHHGNKRSDEGLRRAIEYFEQALDEDPRFAAAHAALADAYVLSGLGYQAMPPRDAFARASEAVRRALELDESLPEAHASLGYVHTMAWEWRPARQELERAIALNPSYAQAHQWYAHHCLHFGDFERALDAATRARELDPLSVLLTNELGWPYFFMGRFDRARDQYRRALDMDPTFAMGHFNVAQTFEHEGRYDEAIPTYEKAVDLSGRLPFITAFLGATYARAGRVADARALLRELVDKAETTPGLHVTVAHVHEALGEYEHALERLERSFAAREPFLPLIGTMMFPLEGLRGHPRFIALRDQFRAGSEG